MITYNMCADCIHIENWDFEKKYFNDECSKSNVRISDDAQMINTLKEEKSELKILVK